MLTAGLLALAAALVALVLAVRRQRQHCRRTVPLSVNYHFTRKCNKECGFCFHTATTSYCETPERAQAALRLLRDAGMRKINFAGGEPFLYPKFLGGLLAFCKDTLRLESVSIVTNGSKVTEAFLRAHARHIDILAVSCDSFDEATNIAIGRGAGDQVQRLYQIAAWCREVGIKFKLNTVVTRLNAHEDMNAHVARLAPFRWKCFQVLIVTGENDSDARLRNAHRFTISDAVFDAFCARHRAQACLVPEPNRLMARSYLILDEYLRFLDRSGRQPSRPILEVGVEAALASVFWDKEAFMERGGVYDWGKETAECGGEASKGLEW